MRFTRYSDEASANASVVTARNGPRTRSAGSPTTIAVAAPASPATSMARLRSDVPLGGRQRADRTADADERHLPE